MISGPVNERNDIEREVSIELGKVTLKGNLGLPQAAKGIVLLLMGAAAVGIARAIDLSLESFNPTEWQHYSSTCLPLKKRLLTREQRCYVSICAYSQNASLARPAGSCAIRSCLAWIVAILVQVRALPLH